MNTIGRSWMRFCFLALLLAGTYVLLRARDREELLPAHDSLRNFPLILGDWQGRDLPISADTLQVLGPGDFLARDYFDLSKHEGANLFIAFFPSQRQGDTIHSPKNCLPGAGWVPAESTRIWLDGQSGRKIEVNRYLLEKDDQRALVLYWYQAHGNVTPSEYRAKYHLIADAIVMNRSDGALIRIATLLRNGDSPADAERNAVRFARLVLPILDKYIPR